MSAPQGTLMTCWVALSDTNRAILVAKLHHRVKLEQRASDGSQHWRLPGRVRTLAVNRMHFMATRVAWAVQYGEYPADTKRIKRLCDDTDCVAPEHHCALTMSTTESRGMHGIDNQDLRHAQYVLERGSQPHACLDFNLQTPHQLWIGYRDKDGYGRLTWRDVNFHAHRLAWLVCNHPREIPSGYVVRHKCRERACVAPEHLEIGTIEDNVADRIRDGTSLHGERAPNATLTQQQADEIRVLAPQLTPSQRAAAYNVSVHVIYRVDSGLTYQPPPPPPSSSSSRAADVNQHITLPAMQLKRRIRPPLPDASYWRRCLEAIKQRCDLTLVDKDDSLGSADAHHCV